jgi:translation initiation factor 1
MSDSRLVYSTDDGDHRRDRPSQQRPKQGGGPALPRDGVVRVFREKGGRGGKTVTVVRGIEGDLAALATDIKRHCGAGGSVKAGAIEVQGDHRDRVVAWLRAAGYAAKPAGG